MLRTGGEQSGLKSTSSSLTSLSCRCEEQSPPHTHTHLAVGPWETLPAPASASSDGNWKAGRRVVQRGWSARAAESAGPARAYCASGRRPRGIPRPGPQGEVLQVAAPPGAGGREPAGGVCASVPPQAWTLTTHWGKKANWKASCSTLPRPRHTRKEI